MTTSSMTVVTARREVRRTEGRSRVASGSNFITPVLLAAASTPERARIMPTKATQLCHTPPVGVCGWKSLRCGMPPKMRAITTPKTGKASQIAMLPVCLGPKKFSVPMTKMALIAHLLAWT